MNSALRSQYLAALGLESWSLRRGPAVPECLPEPGAPAPSLSTPSAPTPSEGVADLGWTELRAAVAACTRCPLSTTRTQTVFGVGSVEAKWLIVGEAPGAEDAQVLRRVLYPEPKSADEK